LVSTCGGNDINISLRTLDALSSGLIRFIKG
jgi:hypothetical protein